MTEQVCKHNYKRPYMQREQCPIYNSTLKTFVCSSSTEICVYKLIETRFQVSVYAVLSYNYTQRKRCSISLHTHISLLDEYTNVLRVLLQITLLVPLIIVLPMILIIFSNIPFKK